MGEDLTDIPVLAGIPGMMFSLEFGTLGVIGDPGTGTMNVTTGENGADSGLLLLNDLYIEAPGAVLATVGDTQVSGSDLHVTMGSEPRPSSRTLVADFTQAPDHGLLLSGKTKSLDGVMNGKLNYKNGLLYVLKAGGTVLILR